MGALVSLLFGFTGRINRAKWWLGLGFIRGTDGPNRYGPDPLARSAAPA